MLTKALLTAVGYAILFPLFYSCFYVTLKDDIEFNFGKKRFRNRRKKYKGFFRKLMFWDFRHEVHTFHLTLLWVFAFMYVVLMSAHIGNILFLSKELYVVKQTALCVCGLCVVLAVLYRWNLYIGNKTRSRKPKKRWK